MSEEKVPVLWLGENPTAPLPRELVDLEVGGFFDIGVISITSLIISTFNLYSFRGILGQILWRLDWFVLKRDVFILSVLVVE